jgi:inorganic pyrophosphatase
MVFVCSGVGVLSMLLISLNAELFTNGAFYPVESLIEKMRSSSAAGVANGLALGYIGTIIPIMLITGAAYFCIKFMGFYGVGLGVIGVLSAFPILIAHQAFSSLTSNAQQMALLANLEE